MILDKNIINGVIQKYSNISNLNLNIIENFISDLYNKLDVNFHPDDPFENYVDDDNKPTFSDNEANALNKIMDRIFDWCDNNQIDIYDIGEPILKRFIEDKENKNIEEDIEYPPNFHNGNLFEEEINEELVNDNHDRLTENIKVGAEYYDQYSQKCFTVDGIDYNSFVLCTNVNDPSDKWNEDLNSFNRMLKMNAIYLIKAPNENDINTDFDENPALEKSIINEFADDEEQFIIPEPNDEYKITNNNKILKIVSSNDPIIKYRIQNENAFEPKVISLKQFEELFNKGIIVKI